MRQVGHLPELYEDALSEKYKIWKGAVFISLFYKGWYTPADIVGKYKLFSKKFSSFSCSDGVMYTNSPQTNIPCFFSPIGNGKQDSVCKHAIS